MKKICLLILCLSLSSCFLNWEGEENNTEQPDSFSRYEPTVLSTIDFERSISVQDQKEITEASKIYITNNLIFINDKRTGFHIFDNSDTANPIKKKFLNAPGATDIAIRGNTLYINQATDLVVLTFDFNTLNAVLSKRVRNVFPELQSPDGERYYEDGKVVVNWIQK